MTKPLLKFSDEQFLSASEKTKIYNAWKRFLKSDFKKGNFTDALYIHLHLHCGFIAHYDRNGFYSTYFVDPEDTMSFLRLFEQDCPGAWKFFENDLTSVMMQELETSKPRILKELHERNIKEKENILESSKKNLQISRKEAKQYA